MNGPQNLQWPGGIGQPMTFQSSFVGPWLSLRITGTCIPRARNDGLVIRDLALLDCDPVRQRTAGCLHEPCAACLSRPGRWIKEAVVERRPIPGRDVAQRGLMHVGEGVRQYFGFDGPGGNAAQGRVEAVNRQIQLLQAAVDQLPGFAVACRIEHQHACQRPHFHGLDRASAAT